MTSMVGCSQITGLRTGDLCSRSQTQECRIDSLGGRLNARRKYIDLVKHSRDYFYGHGLALDTPDIERLLALGSGGDLLGAETERRKLCPTLTYSYLLLRRYSNDEFTRQGLEADLSSWALEKLHQKLFI